MQSNVIKCKVFNTVEEQILKARERKASEVADRRLGKSFVGAIKSVFVKNFI